jgi:ribosomal protein L16/L10AE
MFLAPKRTKFKKSFSRTSILTSKKSQDSPSFGNFFLLASSCGYVSNRQIEALRIFLRRSLKKQAKI